MPERQPTKLPDAGAEISKDDYKRTLRRAMFAGLKTSAVGALGSPNVTKPTLGV
jgi:hypothetical protein